MMKKTVQGFRVAAVFISLSIIPLFAAGCGKKPDGGTPAIRIDNFTMGPREFEETFQEYKIGEDTPENRANYLNNLITRKVMLLEAQRMGLDTQKDFLRSIENFWEQSLLTAVIDAKTKELLAGPDVTEQEIQDYYAKWTAENPGKQRPLEEVRSLVAWRVRAAKEAKALEDWTDQLVRKAKIKVDKQALGIE